jgi:hypothetical protein
METIRNLVAQKYNLFNVDLSKCPVDKNGKKMKDWINKSYDELVEEHNYNSLKWGIKLGEQENGRFIGSLDFDIYNKDKNEDCELTKNRLNNFFMSRELECANDGVYTSSTQGNVNVLFDYTDCPTIKKYVEQIGSAKFTWFGLEILLKGNQVIPPTQTNCKRTKTLGNPRTFKNDKPFCVITENENDDNCSFKYIKNLFDEKLENNKPTKPTKSKTKKQLLIEVAVSDNNSEIIIDKFIDLLFNVIKNEKKGKEKIIDWDTWFQIAGILKYNDYDESHFIKYSELYEKTGEAKKIWESIRNPNKSMCIYGLQNIAKKVNPNGYKDWLIKYNEFLNLEILKKGENDIAKFIAPFLKQNLVYCRKDWWSYNPKTGLWVCVDDPSASITNEIQKKITEALECFLSTINRIEDVSDEQKIINKKIINDYNFWYSHVCTGSINSQLIKYFKTYLSDNDFVDNLDNSLYKLVFKNGILDLKTLFFNKGIKQSDYITKTIPFDYQQPSNEEIDFVKNILKQICNWNDKHLEYYLSGLGYALTGDSKKEQLFWYFRGQMADNGKSFIFESLEVIMPNYIIKANSDFMDKGSDLRKEVDTWRGKKILWINEVSTKQKDEDLVKALCDGTSYKYNKLYSKEAICMPINFKLFAVSNNTLTIKGDAGVKRRFKLCQFNSHFKEHYECDYANLQFKKDKTLGDKICGDYKHALIYLIATYSKMYWEEKSLKEYPKEWSDDADEVMNDNNQFSEWFEETFEVGSDYMIHKAHFNDIFDNSPHKNLKIKDELTRLKIPFKYDSQKQEYENGTRHKGWWVGFKKRKDNNPL